MFELLIVIIFMIIFNAFFAAYEMALASVSSGRLSALLRLKKRGAKEAFQMKERMEGSLAVIQLGITLVGALAAATGGAGADELFAPFLIENFGVVPETAEIIAIILVVLPLSALMIVFGELVPKTFALNNKEWVCLTFSPFMKILSMIFHPIVSCLEGTVKAITSIGTRLNAQRGTQAETHIHELKAAASLARTSKLLSPREEKIVHSATELSGRFVRDAMLPADQISMIPVSLSLSDALIRAHMDMHTRFPICAAEGNPQTITGYVNFKDIIFALHANPADPTLKGIVRPMKAVKENARVSAVLEDLIQTGTHIVLVKDDGGKVLGLLTLEDLLEELVGDIQDEYDKLPTFVHPYLTGWIIGGGAPISIVASTIGLSIGNLSLSDASRIPTLSEWCKLRKKGEFKTSEIIQIEGAAITVRKLRRQQISEAFVTRK